MTITIILCLITCVKAGYEEWELAQHRKEVSHQMAECARELGYEEDSVIIKEAQKIWWEADNVQRDFEEQDVYIAVQSDEYPVAAQVWNYLVHDMGLSESIAAGVIGNMMCECGGQTLSLQPFIYGYGYYGLCMWYLPYANGRLYAGATVEEQLSFLSETMQSNIEYFGGDWEHFLSLDNPYAAAWYFRYYYERGAWADIVGQNAMKAYEYFVD